MRTTRKPANQKGAFRSYKSSLPPEAVLQAPAHETPDQQRYARLIDTYRDLFRIARYPKDSYNGAEWQLNITTQKDEAGSIANRAIVSSLQPVYSQYGVNFLEAQGFSVTWFEYPKGERTQTWTDTFSYGHKGCPQVLRGPYTAQWDEQQARQRTKWLMAIEARAVEVKGILLPAISDPNLNPQLAPCAERYYADHPISNTALQVGHTAVAA